MFGVPKNLWKELLFGSQGREKLLIGAEKVYKAVSATMGPAGKLAVFEDGTQVFPRTTKDGVSVARNIILKDNAEQIGASMVIQAASRQVKDSGDGTTLVTVLAYNMIKNGLAAIYSGVNPAQLRKGIDTGIREIIEALKSISVKIKPKDLKFIAKIAMNGDEQTAELIAEAIEKTGKLGVVTHDRAKDQDDHHVEYIEGYEWGAGNIYQEFVNQANGTCEELNPAIILSDSPLAWGDDLQKLYEIVQRRPTFVICNEVRDEALQAMVKNLAKGIRIIPVRIGGLPKEREYILQDLKAITGASIVGQKTGKLWKNITEADVGQCEKLMTHPGKTRIYGGSKEAVAERVKFLEAKKKLLSEDKHEVELIEKSMAKLTGGMAIIRIGGSTESEQTEIMDRVDDAIHACRSAEEEGIVPGGGVALLQCKTAHGKTVAISPLSKDANIGRDIVLKAIECQAAKILENADIRPDLVIEKILSGERAGYDIYKENSEVKSMIDQGIVDPTKVIRTALLNAASVAKMILQSEVVIIDNEIKSDKK